MIREDRFLISRRPYAIDLASLIDGPVSAVTAVWFRRKQGATVACIGNLWDTQRPTPKDVAEFLARHTDGRYGGTCEGRWDGEHYWGAQKPDTIAEHLELLRPMLANYPAIPAGYDGWWRF
ncbi:hypothetical protein [Streptomyces sp. NRRL S-1824]|uniref:hypothetical protein n=1 Tax=Streptomyces sp. NRRL S-1824 TaxID=1463889 RepID=UPI0004CA63E8|nr:hypothetical protein [Streptomyces sp. NRRL S-1824]